MGDETLREGVVRVKRPDADWLKSVRDGALTYDEVIDLTVSYEARLAEMIAESPLSIEPDEATVEELLIVLQRDFMFPTD